MATRDCANCGAASKSATARYCEYCGTELPRPEAPVAAPSPSPFGDVEARLAAVRAHPDFAAAQRETPSGTKHSLGFGVQIAATIFFVLVAGFVSLSFFAVCPPMGLLPLAVLGLGVVALVKAARQGAEYANAPLERIPALIVDERTTVSSGSGDSHGSTRDYVTLEGEDGERVEFQVDGDVAGLVTRGDVGVAFVRGPALLDFRRVRV